ncbi:unnamed protein product [Diatraea saccharalis]|uniref:C2H2-type domain-containing protein n=1 Tax=Diatraea saccharalis TaxID=40085 RepID=A0A9N9QYF3_9NEOP|nr:unnamed protein product [Diatraea saccharalis]
MSRKCKNCNKYLCKIPGYKKIIKNEEEAKVFSDCLNKIVIVNDIFCKKCRLTPYINKKASTSKCAAFNLAEIMDDQNNLSVQYVKSAPNIIKAEVKSRHINRKVYRIYIHYISEGEKPHVCMVCNKGFSTSSSLNTHRRIHSGEKPHQCQHCGKRFTASSNLYYHRMTHIKGGKVMRLGPWSWERKLLKNR